MLFYRYLSRDGFVGNVKKMDLTIVNILEYIRMKSNIATKIISSILHDKSKTFACDIWFKIFARYGTPYDKKLDE